MKFAYQSRDKKSPFRPRALIVIQNVSFSYDTRMQKVAHSLEQAGHDVLVISPRYPHDASCSRVGRIESWHYPFPKTADGIIWHLLEYSYSLLAISTYSLWALIRRRVRIVHMCSPPDILFPLAALFRLLGRRVIVDFHDLSPELIKVRYRLSEGNLLVRLVRTTEKLMLRLATRIVTTNNTQKELLAKRSSVPLKQISVIHNGIDLAMIPDANSTYATRNAAVGYLGTVNPQDGVDLLLRAMGHIRHVVRRNDIQLTLIGDGGCHKSMIELANSLELGDSVIFTGRLLPAEALAQLSGCVICVQPDPKNEFNDTCCMVKSLEYMSLGKPFVAFKLRETVHCCGSAALYATENSPVKLAEQIVNLIDDPVTCQRLGAEGVRRVNERFTWQQSEHKLLELYRELSES